MITSANYHAEMLALAKQRLSKALENDWTDPRMNNAIERTLAWLDGNGQLASEEVNLVAEVLSKDPASEHNAHRRLTDQRVQEACRYVLDLFDPAQVSETN